MNIYESAEDYLERILILQEKNDGVRSIDIAHDMGFSKPSISVAMKKLKEAGLIDIDKHGFITLTKEGHVIADKVYERHKVLKKVLVDIGVDPKQAEKDACKVEHVISEETFEAIKKHIKWQLRLELPFFFYRVICLANHFLYGKMLSISYFY